MSRLTALTGKMKLPMVLKAYDGTELQLELDFAKVDMLGDIVPFLNKKEGDPVTKEHMVAFTKLSKDLLKNSVPDATDAEVQEVVIQNINVLAEAFKKMLYRSVERMNVEDKKKVVEELSKNG